jgi:putative heme-binding domain-containing protein
MTIRSWPFVVFWAVLLTAYQVFAATPFEDAVRKTEPLSPEQERQAFHLPPGFEAQLVASEPEIGKPMNMAFDAKGRLWLTQSREYPYPVLPVDKKGRDKIMVLEDFDATGRARKITTFVEGLNIPIGLYPYKDGVIAFSIPKVHFFRDTDGDGRADKDEVLLTGLGYEKDTHGLTSNFRRGYDGYIYADHGFNNDSTILGRDGSTITINSGNCYRFKPDGTRVEQHSFGQVNPFGLMFDPLGDLWSTDCHSSPTYMLLRGAYYPSFGKPHDGLGFGPDICKHTHGSTAICGMVFYDDDQFPEEFRWNTYIGNVMSCRINRDSYLEHGSTRLAKAEQDFLSSDDPWFRPVMLDLGPDGAIYVADFYNRIIGHYEVPLDHPGRDRERGRVWRIVYKGNKEVRSSRFDLSTMTDSKLVAELGSPNITRRTLATDQLVERLGKPAAKRLSRMVNDKKATPSQKAHGLWALSRLGSLDEKTLATMAGDKDRTVRVHAMRVLSETEHWTPQQAELARKGASDTDPYVQRAAADAMSRHVTIENVPPLLQLCKTAPADDLQLIHTARMALRNQLASDETLRAVSQNLNEEDRRAVADVAVAIKTETAAGFLLDHLSSVSNAQDKLQSALRHIARYGPVHQMERLREFADKRFENDLDFQLVLFRAIQEGIGQRGAVLTAGLREWGGQLAERLLASVNDPSLQWHSIPIKGKESADPWFLQKRRSAGGGGEDWFICSLPPGGENLTGILRSQPFLIPSEFNFYLAGHDGFPEKPPGGKNLVRLIEDDTDKVLASAAAPRNDTAQPITWELKEFSGKKGYLELVDGDTGAAFAWLAAGRFDPEVVTASGMMPAEVDRRRVNAADLIAELKFTNLEKPLGAIFQEQTSGIGARCAAAKALMKISPSAHEREMARVLGNLAEPQKLRAECARALAESGQTSASKIVIDALATAPHGLQTQLALALAGNVDGAQALLLAIEQGKASRRLLQDKSIKDKLAAAKLSNFAARLERLTQGLPAADAVRQKLIDQRAAEFNSHTSSIDAGAQVFKQTCATCHSIDGQGSTIGPQLDGAGNRGAERLIEDILDPSRNADPAFRVSLFTLKSGEVESGLIRREEGETVVIAEATGKERSIPKMEITERRESVLSLMPDNFSDLIKPEDFDHLLAYLLSKGSNGSH